jgi:hypothetical protein
MDVREAVDRSPSKPQQGRMDVLTDQGLPDWRWCCCASPALFPGEHPKTGISEDAIRTRTGMEWRLAYFSGEEAGVGSTFFPQDGQKVASLGRGFPQLTQATLGV